MARKINSVVVLGGGTMGAGIAALCAQKDNQVLLLDINKAAAEQALDRIVNGRPPSLDDPEKAKNITIGTIENDLDKIENYDWICEAVVEDLKIKRELFEKLEPLRRDGSIVSTNTSGITLSDITKGMPDRLQQDVAVTHFFNPVKVMRLLELVPGKQTTPDVTDALSEFCRNVLGKGVVNAKDTVNFIGNRIGCYWILAGLHYGIEALEEGFSVEEVDAMISQSMGLPPTGLFGLVDLVGLDVMDLVSKNLSDNLPSEDLGLKFVDLPGSVRSMIDRGQIGRKAGGGFYRVQKLDDGSRKSETFDVITGKWRDTIKIEPDGTLINLEAMFKDDKQGKLLWQIVGGTLIYAADLIPEISDDVVNIDRAMRWGYAWNRGPFELLDQLSPTNFSNKLSSENIAIPRMLNALKDAGAEKFYIEEAKKYFDSDGTYRTIPIN
jgi:3-hydroxyacyl-CoA dehydrogenase